MKYEVGDKFRDKQGRVLTIKAIVSQDKSYIVMYNGIETSVSEMRLDKMAKVVVRPATGALGSAGR